MVRTIPVPLPRLLSLLPKNGVGASCYPSRWAGKGLPTPSSPAALDVTCRWEITRVRLNVSDDAVSGRAFGVHFHKGKRITPEGRDELVRGGTKYTWLSATPPPLLDASLLPPPKAAAVE